MLSAFTPRRCAVTESMGGVLPLNNLLAGITADVIAEHDPAGDTFIRLLDAVEHHASLEEEALGQYEHLAQASGDPVIALVMRLILDDEERHHSLLRLPRRCVTRSTGTMRKTHCRERPPLPVVQMRI